MASLGGNQKEKGKFLPLIEGTGCLMEGAELGDAMGGVTQLREHVASNNPQQASANLLLPLTLAILAIGSGSSPPAVHDLHAA